LSIFRISDVSDSVKKVLPLFRAHTKRKEDRTSNNAEVYCLTVDAMRAVDSIDYITNHLKKAEEQKTYRDDWKYSAMVIDGPCQLGAAV
jgi:hypothetical protein